MALVVGALEVVLRTSLDQFTGSMRSAASVVDQSSRSMARSTDGAAESVTRLERSVSGFGSRGDAFRALTVSALRAKTAVNQLENAFLLLPAAIGGVGLAAGVRALTNYADAATLVRNKLSTITTSASARIDAEREVFEIAQRTRSEYGATTALFARTTQAAQNLGRSQAEISRFTEAVMMTGQISGATTQEAQAGAIQLAQGLASNRLQGDELRSILENNVALAQVLANELAGGSIGRLREMGTEGLLTAQQVLDAVLRASDDISQRFARTQATFANSFVIVSNALTKYVGDLDSAIGGSKAFFDLMSGLANNLPTVASGLAMVAAGLVAIGAVRIGRGISEGITSRRAEANALLQSAREAAAIRAREAESARQQALQQAQAARVVADTAGGRADREIASRATVAALTQEERALQKIEAARAREAEAFARNQAKMEAALVRTQQRRNDLYAEAMAKSRELTLGMGSQQRVEAAFSRVAEQEARARDIRDQMRARETGFIGSDRVASGNAALQLGAVTQAQAAVAASAAAERARLASVAADENRRLAAATSDAARASLSLAGASAQAASGVGLLRGAAQAVGGMASSLFAFLGGGWGVLFTAAAAGAALLAMRTAEAAQKAEEYKAALEGVPRAIERANAAVTAARLGQDQSRSLTSTRADLLRAQEARQGSLANLFGDMGNDPSLLVATFESLRQAGASLPDRQGANARPGEALRQMRALFESGSVTADQIDKVAEAITRMSDAGQINAGRAANLVKALDDQANAARRVVELQQTLDLLSRANQPNTPEFLRGTQERDVMGQLAMVEQQRAAAQQADQAMAMAKANAEAAKGAFDQLAASAVAALTVNTTGEDYATRLGISERAKTQISEAASALAVMRSAATQIGNVQTIGLVEQFAQGSITLQQFKQELSGISSADAGVRAVERAFVENAEKVNGNINVVGQLQRAINALTGKTIQIDIVARMRDAINPSYVAPNEEENVTGREIRAQSGAAAERLRRARLSPEQRRREDVGREFPLLGGGILDQIASAEAPKRRGGGGKSDAEKSAESFAKVMKELRNESASAKAGLTELDNEVVRYAKSAKIAEADTQAFIAAVSRGAVNEAPEKLRQIRAELEQIQAVKLAERYATPQETYARNVAGINANSALTPEQRNRFIAEEGRRTLAQTVEGQMASAVSQGIKQGLTTGDWSSAAQQMASRLLNILLDELMRPFEDALRSALRGGLSGAAGGGSGGGVGSLFGSIFSGIGSLFGLPTSHTGGLVGVEHGPPRYVSAAMIASAPRFHSGLTSREFAAVLERGEHVLTEKQAYRTTAALDGLSRNAAPMGANVTVGGTTITIQGNADEKTLALLRAELAARDRALPGQMRQAIGDMRVRGAV
jgi:tape measure domain-containing protein